MRRAGPVDRRRLTLHELPRFGKPLRPDMVLCAYSTWIFRLAIATIDGMRAGRTGGTRVALSMVAPARHWRVPMTTNLTLGAVPAERR
jgi:hypothetical protein